MGKQILMGNGAAAFGALAAGVGVACGYPGTPSTECLETLTQTARERNLPVHTEWSINEKCALELASAASMAGLRTLVTMKQVGLNVASDPLMSLAYLGVRGGMVVYVADDPGPISSQTEQDTRTFAAFAKLPVFDPATPEELYAMTVAAFDLSERYQTPVIVRPTTRICHAAAVIETEDTFALKRAGNFEKDSKWVIFPKLSHKKHAEIEIRNPKIGEEFSDCAFNSVSGGGGKTGIAAGGVSFAYVSDILRAGEMDVPLLKIGTPFPFPEKLALEFLRGKEKILVCEELDPVIERELTYLCGKHGVKCEILGKNSGHIPHAGESGYDALLPVISAFAGREIAAAPTETPAPGRPPSLCLGCPHRLSFGLVKQAVGDRKAIYCGDIGCYTLGFEFQTTDTCLCMGAGITMAQGFSRAEPDALCVAFTGDSTFFAAGLTGVANAVYNRHDILICVLDNRITAMTGGQPAPDLDIAAIMAAMGAKVRAVDPKKRDESLSALNAAIEETGVRAVIFRSPCITLCKGGAA